MGRCRQWPGRVYSEWPGYFNPSSLPSPPNSTTINLPITATMPLLSKLIGAAQAIKNKKTTARRFLRARQMMLDNLKARQLPRRACQKPTEVGEPTDFVFPQFGEEPEVEVTSNM